MKNLIFICLSTVIIAATSCSPTKANNDCMHCYGCFNQWTECESDWHNDSITWEEHRDTKIAENQYSTDHCELVRE
jgi:hypothetical protein